MNAPEIDALLASQKRFYESGATLPLPFRAEMLRKLYDAVKNREGQIAEALRKDLGKSDFEGYFCETGLVLSEISYQRKHLKKFAREKRVHTPLAQFASRSYVKPSPMGNTLIMSPWNYPLLLTLDPLADAIAAGDTAIVKPSAYSPATSRVMAEMISATFPQEYIAVVEGGRAENAALLDRKFDFIFFTGSQSVGRRCCATPQST